MMSIDVTTPIIEHGSCYYQIINGTTLLYETMQDVCGMGLPTSWVRHVVTPTLCQSKYYTSSPPSCSYHPRTTGTRVSISDQLLNICNAQKQTLLCSLRIAQRHIYNIIIFMSENKKIKRV